MSLDVANETIGGPGPGRSAIGQSVGRRVRGRIGLNPSLGIGMAIIGVLMILALLAGVLSPDNPLKQDISNALAPPGGPGHPLGTDALGRDVLSRLLYAAR